VARAKEQPCRNQPWGAGRSLWASVSRPAQSAKLRGGMWTKRRWHHRSSPVWHPFVAGLTREAIRGGAC
jgi:hypothetical protein